MRKLGVAVVAALAAALPAGAEDGTLVTSCTGGETDLHAIALDDDTLIAIDPYATEGWVYLTTTGGLSGTHVWFETNTVKGLQTESRWCEDYYRMSDGTIVSLGMYELYPPDTPALA